MTTPQQDEAGTVQAAEEKVEAHAKCVAAGFTRDQADRLVNAAWNATRSAHASFPWDFGELVSRLVALVVAYGEEADTP